VLRPGSEVLPVHLAGSWSRRAAQTDSSLAAADGLYRGGNVGCLNKQTGGPRSDSTVKLLIKDTGKVRVTRNEQFHCSF
jgi:hypothetical protein